MEKDKTKLIVILGPTASGKTKLAVDLARRFAGEIVSADSRQVYRGMDIGTGKDLGDYGEQLLVKSDELVEEGKARRAVSPLVTSDKSLLTKVPYHLIDVAEPQEVFTLADFKKQADAAIEDIAKRGKLPMLVGGSGLYLQAVVDNYELAENLGVDEVLRSELEQLSVAELFGRLADRNQEFANRLNNSDRNNKRRLVRYIEIQSEKRKAKSEKVINTASEYDCLILGLIPERGIMESKIKRRLIERLEKEDMVGEVERLRRQGVSDKRLKDFGLEYRFITEYLEEKYSYEELVEKLFIAIRQFAKRQITWFRRWERQGRVINWVKSEAEAIELVEKFLINS